MADIVLSPIPYNAGALVRDNFTFDYCHLGNGKFMHVLAQVGPGFIYAYVSNNANIKSGTFASTVPTMRAVLSGSNVPTTIQSLRVVKLSSKRAALIVNAKIYVLEVQDLTDDVLARAATASIVSTYATNAPALTPAAVISTYGPAVTSTVGSTAGTYWSVFYARDNVLYSFERTYVAGTNSYTITLYSYKYDGTADTLTKAALQNYSSASSAGLNSFTRFMLQDIPGSTAKLATIRAQNTPNTGSATLTGSTIVAAWVMDGTTDGSTVVGGTFPTGVQTLCPLSPTTILGFTNTRSYYTYTGGAWNTTAAVFASAGNTGIVLQAEPLDANYFVLFSTNSTELVGNQTYAVRIGRFVDGAFGQVSAGTASFDGVSFNLIAAHHETTFFVRDGTDAFYGLGRNSSFVPQIKVIYQAGG